MREETYAPELNGFIIMANKRELKKRINFVCGGLFAECVAAYNYASREVIDVVDRIGNMLS